MAGHFGLAVEDYTHATAPNRRYPDLITQRLLKAAMAGWPIPYRNDELETLARHCTEEEDAAKKVERQVTKSAAAILLESRTGEKFDAIVTGASNKGMWVRLFDPPIEGRLESGFEGMAVGQGLRVQLVRTAAEAVTLFCYQVKKWIGAFAAILGGLDTLVFAGGIGENAPTVRTRICDGLKFLGIELEEKRNTANEGIISSPACRVRVRVIRTDEERMIAEMVCRVLGLGMSNEKRGTTWITRDKP